MIRGVNKNIIEVISTDNQYFERAILFVKSSCNTDKEVLNRKAGEYIKSLPMEKQSIKGYHQKNSKFIDNGKLLISALIGGGIATIIIGII